MRNRFTLKQSFSAFALLLGLLSLLVLGALQNLTRNIDTLKRAEQLRYQTTQLATQYRMLTESMTRNVMAFVASEQPEFEEDYRHLQDILHGHAPDTQGLKQAFLDRFMALGVTPDEMARLSAVDAAIARRTSTEIEAISTASGQFDDGQGGLRVALPNALMAKVMIFGQEYAQASAAIARSIAEVDAMQSARLDDQVQAANDQSRSAYRIAASAIATLLGCSALALRALYASIKRPLEHGVALAEQLAQGRLDARHHLERRDELGRLLNALNGIGNGLHGAVSAVRQRATRMAGEANALASGQSRLSQRTREQASSVQQTASAMEALSVAVKRNAANAEQSRQLVDRATQCALGGGRTVLAAVEAIRKTQEEARNMSDITGLIRDIAFQTNILALNAAVEAARAGQYGKGFAVVAAEVRSLALRSAKASRDIEQLIGTSRRRLDEGGAQAEAAAVSMEEIVGSVREVDTIIHQIADASQQQSQGIQEIASAISHLEAITRENSRMVQETTRSTALQEELADKLMHALSHFRLGDEDDLEGLAAHSPGNGNGSSAEGIGTWGTADDLRYA